jgi:DNA polymerase-3 subunit gamma/tau
MSYQVLARKWRPKTFEQVVGQTTVTRTLQNALSSGRIGHAFLLSGARGVGKTTTARILAKALNCGKGEAATASPCDECSSCAEITSGSSLDVHEIDGATNNGVEQVRELRESARYNPARDRFKVWIIDEVHMLSTGAFNALLKTLEEPPPRVKFIFATTEYHKLPDTIVSRCQQYDFRLIPARELQAHLREIADAEKIQVSDEALGRLARAAEGSVRDALSLFDQVLAYSGNEVRDDDLHALLGLIDRELLTTVSRAAAEGDSLALMTLVERLADFGADYRNFVRELMLHFRELLVLKVAPAGSTLLGQILPDERERLAPIVAAYSEEDLLRIFDVLTKADTDMRLAPDPRVVLELALLKLVQLRRLMPFADLVARVEAMAGGAPLPPRPTPPVRTVPVAPPPAPRPAPAPAPAPALAPPPPPAPATVVAAAPAATPTPVPAPAPVPVSASAGAADKSSPAGLLAAMIEAAQTRPSLIQPLRVATAEKSGDTLVLTVAADFAAFAQMHAEEYQQLATKAAGRPVKVRVSAGGATAAAPSATEAEAPSAVDTRKQDLMEQATREPAVQEALDLFGARIVDVRNSQ